VKILHTVQLYHPKVGGSEEVVKQLSERMAARGHDVTVATMTEPTRKSLDINGVKIKEFDISGNNVRGIKGDPKPYIDYVTKSQFDVVMNYAAQIWSTDLLMPHLDEIKAAKVIVPCGYSALKDPEYSGYFKKLPNYLKKYDTAIYLSRHYQDKQFADQHKLSNSLVIPNGADEGEFELPISNFKRKYGVKTKYVLLCVANHYNLKGHQFVIDAFNRLGRKDTSLVIIGNPVVDGYRKWRVECYKQCKMASLKNQRIKVLTNVPRTDVVSAYKESDIFVFGSMVECSPLVIFESMAAGIPFISTDVGDIKERAKFGKLVESPEEMASDINYWLNNPDERDKIGKSAQAEWKKKYSWDKITDQYLDLYTKLLK
jgi:glycosyltransferase involved in cell wall biosynthesis